MALTRPPYPDALRPTEQQALDAWAGRVRAYREQSERFRETEDPVDFYAAFTRRFARDPRRTDDTALAALLSLTEPADTWLDIGAGAGRYALPLALRVATVHAIDPSPSMLAALRDSAAEHGIENIDPVEGSWPLDRGAAVAADAALIAHVGYTIDAIGPFLDSIEAAVSRRCVAIMRVGAQTSAAARFWPAIHGEERVPLPALPELVTLLLARGSVPDVEVAAGPMSSASSVADLIETARRHLRLRPGSAKDQQLASLVEAAATERDGGWTLGEVANRVGVVSWEPRSR